MLAKIKQQQQQKKIGLSLFFCSPAPASNTCSPVLLPCFPSVGVPVPLRLPKSTHHNKTTTTTTTKSVGRLLFFYPPVTASSTHSPFLLPCFPSIQGPAHALCLCSGPDGWGWVFSSPGLPLPPRSNSSPPARNWGEGRSSPTGPGFVSYPLHKALGSQRC